MADNIADCETDEPCGMKKLIDLLFNLEFIAFLFGAIFVVMFLIAWF